MGISQQEIQSIYIKKLKNIQDLTISFEGKKVTGILGPNGNGKSTILHALACAFQPVNDGDDYKFSSFFMPSPDALWQGSELEITYSYRDGIQTYSGSKRRYAKKSSRWTPRYSRRPKRDVYYIGIDKCVPVIESEKKRVKINYSTQKVNEEITNTILEKASFIFNEKYYTYNLHHAKGKKFIGVEVDGLRYSAFSMSAGEQKVFFILEKLFKAEKYSLFLIDEIDLLLHDIALKKFIKVIHERAEDKGIQVVFTTHRESILELSDFINIRHIINKDSKTLCFNETKPDAITRLTGEQQRPIEVFVEDDLASQIVQKIAFKLKIVKYVSIERFGAAINCFTTVGGLLLGREKCDKSLFVLDGDVYREYDDKLERINAVITGTDNHAKNLRESALSKIRQFTLPENTKPEYYLHQIISNMKETQNGEFDEIIEVAKRIVVTDESHKYINDIIEGLGLDSSVGLSKIIDLLSTSDEWDTYVQEIYDWLNPFVDIVRESEL